MKSFETAFHFLQNAVTKGASPCAAAAVGVKNKLIRMEIYGNSRLYPTAESANLSTRFDMASMTKILVTTTVTLRFLEMGLLHLHDKIGDFFQDAGEFSSVTIVQLLTHSGGFVPYLNLKHICRSKDEVLSSILSSAPICKPGTQVFYSCMGFIVLGKILEKVGQISLDCLAQSLVFTPLHMDHTSYCPSGSNFAATEMSDNSCFYGVVHDENARFMDGISGNAGVFSDLHDMTIFASMLASGGYHHGETFLQSATLNQAIKCYTEGLEQRRGLGFHLQSPGSFHGKYAERQYYGHTGFTGTSLLVDPHTGLYIVLLSNRVHPTRENTLFLQVRREFHDLVISDFSLSNFSDKFCFNE